MEVLFCGGVRILAQRSGIARVVWFYVCVFEFEEDCINIKAAKNVTRITKVDEVTARHGCLIRQSLHVTQPMTHYPC